MGEYAQLAGGRQIKIGTCEDMYYLRHAHRYHVTAERGSLNPATERAALRFRFPWPDEDGLEPGHYDGGGYRAVWIPGAVAGQDVEHGLVQFTAAAGYNVCLPCPEDPKAPPFAGHRNGFRGAVRLVAQRYRPDTDRLVPVLECGGCGRMWRIEDSAEIEQLALHLRSAADQAAASNARQRQPGSTAEDGRVAFYHAIADRLLADAKILAV